VDLLTAALLAAAAVLLGTGAGGAAAVVRRRVRSPAGGSADAWARPGRVPDAPGRTGALGWAGPVGMLAGVAAWLLVGGWAGAGAGTLTALAVPALVRRLEPGHVRRERLELARAAPLVADLLAASLAAGVPAERALPAVARSIGGATGARLGLVHRRMELGEPAAHAWRAVADCPGLAGIGRAVGRSERTGAPLATMLSEVADELRAEASALVLAHVRAASVRAVLPLGLCLLPAFGLLGIVPVVAGLLPSF
jgi:Flp pilus assembly protein TadB